MGFATGIVGHAHFAMSSLKHVIEFIETQLRATKRFTIYFVDLLTVEDDRLDLSNNLT